MQSSIKQKSGICLDCTDGKEKPLTAKRCQLHYRIYRAEQSEFKKKKRAEMNAFLGQSEPDKTGQKKPKAIPKVSAKQIERLAKYRKVRDEFMKLHPTCQAKLERCTIKATDTHHSRGRTGDLLTDKRYFKALCRNCHQYIETHPTFAREMGLSANRL